MNDDEINQRVRDAVAEAIAQRDRYWRGRIARAAKVDLSNAREHLSNAGQSIAAAIGELLDPDPQDAR